MLAESVLRGMQRTLLVCRTRGHGRELLRAATNAGRSWLGIQPTTMYDLALELIAPALARSNTAPADDLNTLALLDEAIDEVLAQHGAAVAEPGAPTAGVGFRDAVRNSIQALRLEQLTVEALRATAGVIGSGRIPLFDILHAYERRLSGQRKIDRAGVLALAAEALRSGAATLPPARILLAPDVDGRGVHGALIGLLLERGAEILRIAHNDEAARGSVLAQRGQRAAQSIERLSIGDDEAARGRLSIGGDDVASISYDFFSAASITDELREVLRRALSAGAHWDEVEIIATNAIVYGCALDALATRLDVPVSYAVGLPIERTRAGRAITGYLRWIDEDFRVDVLRSLLESGSIEAPQIAGSTRIEPVALANRLRRLRIGWGRPRYLPALQRALTQNAANAPVPEEPLWDGDEMPERTPDARADAWERERAELLGLQMIIGTLLSATPLEVGTTSADAVQVSAGELAAGLLALLRLVPVTTRLEQSACDALRRRLDRVATTLTRRTDLRAALVTLRDRLDMRVPAVSAEEPPPWGSAGGHVHLSDVEHGGWTGRRFTYVVGLDSGRFPGPIVQDPLLTDEDRRRINRVTGSALAASADRIEERRNRLVELLARLRGQVTLSYSAWDASEARKTAPAALVLQAFRTHVMNPHATYEDLHDYIGAPVTSVPRGNTRLDASDVWLGALAGDGVLRNGVAVARTAFRGLDGGLHARDMRLAATLNEFSGRVVPRPDRLDPRRNHEILVSASRLETLGTCPLKYFYSYVLSVAPPEDPELEPGAWLDPRTRGVLFHRVFERAFRMARLRGLAHASDDFEQLVYDVLDAEAQLMLEEVPAPSEGVYRRELREMRGDAWAFVDMARTTGDWLELELDFGRSNRVELDVPNGTILLTGRIDRVDAAGDELLVIDYKTGSTYGHDRRIYNGGRRIQHVLYTHAVQKLLGRPVSRMEYHFPSVRGRNERKPYPQSSLTQGTTVIGELLDLVAQGSFAPTDDPGDCKFCDYKTACRVRLNTRGEVEDTPCTRLNSRGVQMDAVVALTQFRRRYV
jgi:hypothetical protein